MAYNPNQPRDYRGRWTKTDGVTYRQNTPYSAISNMMLIIPLSFFEDLSKQSVSQLKKGIRSKKRVVERHQRKILDPRSVYPEWDGFTDERKQREIAHWKKEIATHKKEIEERERLIEERGRDE